MVAHIWREGLSTLKLGETQQQRTREGFPGETAKHSTNSAWAEIDWSQPSLGVDAPCLSDDQCTQMSRTGREGASSDGVSVCV